MLIVCSGFHSNSSTKYPIASTYCNNNRITFHQNNHKYFNTRLFVASVLDLIGGSRSTTPISLNSRKSPTADMAVQVNQKDGGRRNQNQRNGPHNQQMERRDSSNNQHDNRVNRTFIIQNMPIYLEFLTSFISIYLIFYHF